VCVCALSCWTVCDPMNCSLQAPLSMRFPRQDPPPGDLHNPGIEPTSPVSLALAGRFFTTESFIGKHMLVRLVFLFSFTIMPSKDTIHVFSFNFTTMPSKDPIHLLVKTKHLHFLHLGSYFFSYYQNLITYFCTLVYHSKENANFFYIFFLNFILFLNFT